MSGGCGEGLVEAFEFSDTNRDVRLRFSRRVIESITARRKDGQFAMIEPGMLSQLSSAAHVLFYAAGDDVGCDPGGPQAVVAKAWRGLS